MLSISSPYLSVHDWARYGEDRESTEITNLDDTKKAAL
jgi:hypothetical protein